MAKTKEKNTNSEKNTTENKHRGRRPQSAHKKSGTAAKETARTRELPPRKPRSAGIDHLFADFLPPIAL